MGQEDQEPGFDAVLTSVGPLLRSLRAERGATLAQLSQSTGISTSTLSRLESGQRKPTLELLLPLARTYQVPLDELVGAPLTGDPRIHPRPFRRGDQVFVPLTRYLGGPHAYKTILPGCSAAQLSAPLEQRTHEGHDWLYVLSGRLRLALGERELELVAGEAAEFDTRVPHGFASATSEPVELLTLFGPQGERLHVRARTTDRAPSSGE